MILCWRGLDPGYDDRTHHHDQPGYSFILFLKLQLMTSRVVTVKIMTPEIFVGARIEYALGMSNVPKRVANSN